MLKHEVHFLGRYFFRCDDEIAFVLTIFVIYYYHELSFANILNCLFDCIHRDLLFDYLQVDKLFLLILFSIRELRELEDRAEVAVAYGVCAILCDPLTERECKGTKKNAHTQAREVFLSFCL